MIRARVGEKKINRMRQLYICHSDDLFDSVHKNTIIISGAQTKFIN